MKPAGQFVVYMMQHVLRAHENAALDTAVTAANTSGLPLLILIAVQDRY